MQAFLPFLISAFFVCRGRQGARRGGDGGGCGDVGRKGGWKEGPIIGGRVALILVAPLGQGLELVKRLRRERREGGDSGKQEGCDKDEELVCVGCEINCRSAACPSFA